MSVVGIIAINQRMTLYNEQLTIYLRLNGYLIHQHCLLFRFFTFQLGYLLQLLVDI